MWLIVVMLMLKTGPEFYKLPKQYVSNYQCAEAIEKLEANWKTIKGAVVAYKCRRILPV